MVLSTEISQLAYSPHSGVEPLTPDDIAEVIVFNATRRENVVVADTLIYPNHQVRLHSYRDSLRN